MLLTTQYLDEADRLADEIVVIDRGQAIASGTAAELKSRVGRERLVVTVGPADDPTVAAGGASRARSRGRHHRSRRQG